MFVRQQKTGNEVDIPLHGALKTALKYAKVSNSTFLTTSYGNPYTPDGFGNWFRDQCHQAGLSGCTAHGLRKAAARRLAEAGATANEIIAITGHSNITEVTVYTREAENRRLATQGINKVARVFQD